MNSARTVTAVGPLTQPDALAVVRKVYGETAFARFIGDMPAVGWFTSARDWEYAVGHTWREALQNAGLLARTHG